jgi:hypothetical protein
MAQQPKRPPSTKFCKLCVGEQNTNNMINQLRCTQSAREVARKFADLTIWENWLRNVAYYNKDLIHIQVILNLQIVGNTR